MKTLLIVLVIHLLPAVSAATAAPVTTTAELVDAVQNGAEGSTIKIRPDTFELNAPLEPKAGITLTGRGVIWINEPCSNLTVRNNHIVTRTTATPRQDGLVGFNKDCDFSTIRLVNNIIECQGQSRGLLRRAESYATIVENNLLTNVSDTSRYKNTQTGKSVGLEAPLTFQCGVHGELTVDGWEVRPTQNADRQ